MIDFEDMPRACLAIHRRWMDCITTHEDYWARDAIVDAFKAGVAETKERARRYADGLHFAGDLKAEKVLRAWLKGLEGDSNA